MCSILALAHSLHTVILVAYSNDIAAISLHYKRPQSDGDYTKTKQLSTGNQAMTNRRATTLVATAAGLAAIGITSEDAHTARDTTTTTETAPTVHTQREGAKQAALIAIMRAPDGATLAEIVAATGWLKHTARAFMSGALKKRLGLIVTSETEDQRGRVYRIL